MATGFKVAQIGNYAVDVDDILIRREYFNDGTLWGCGFNNYGQLGDNTSSNRSSPVTTAGGGTNWKQVACGGNLHTAGIKTDGTLWTCGYNTDYSLGDYTGVNKSSPVTTVAGGTNWKQVACGSYHFAAIKTDGTLWTWGVNNYGSVGDGTTTVRKSSPGTVSGGGTNWKQVSCSNYHTAAIKTDGTLWTWGWGDFGQLGDGTQSSRLSPVTTAGGTNWKQVSCGYNYCAAVNVNGTLWTWGDNYAGKLGDGTTSLRSSPVTVAGGGTNWKQVSCGNYHTAAIKTDGTLWTWGYNSYGELGDGTTSSRRSPVTTAGGGTNWKQVACGGHYYSGTVKPESFNAAIKTDGTLWTWGNNSLGELATNNNSKYSSPVTTVAGGTNWKQVSCSVGGYTLVAVTDLTI